MCGGGQGLMVSSRVALCLSGCVCVCACARERATLREQERLFLRRACRSEARLAVHTGVCVSVCVCVCARGCVP